MNSITQKYQDKFLRKLDKEKSNIFCNGSRCWEWIGNRDKDGYGILSIDAKPQKAHRIIF